MFSFMAAFELFWFVSFVGVIAIAFLIENANIGWATLLTVILAVLAYFHYDGLGAYVMNNPSAMFGWAMAYLAGGLVWALAKWYLFVRKVLVKYRDFEASKRKSYSTQASWYDAIINNRDFYNLYETTRSAEAPYHTIGLKICPKVSKEKDRVMGWMVFWPISFVFTMLDDPIQKLFEGMFNRTRKIFEMISEKIFESVNREINSINIEKDKA